MTPTKPAKPYKDFPLFLHRTGQYAKKVRGRTIYFGVDPDAALAKWLAGKDYYLAGRTPPLHPNGCSVQRAVNEFLHAKKLKMDAGELSPRSWRDYYATGVRLVEVLGKSRLVDDLDGKDFEALRAKLATTRGPVALGNEIQRVRTIFTYAFEADIIDRPVKFGASFAKPSRKVIRRAKQEMGKRLFEADQLRKIIDAADVTMKAMTLLAINCGLGQSDLAGLPLDAIDLKRGWLDFPRIKTAIPRRCPLWPETVAALRAAIEQRPDPKADEFAGLVFLTRFGVPWVRMRERDDKPATPIDSIQQEWRKLLVSLSIPHESFYSLRRTFRTVADAARDPVAIDFIMGHVDSSMGATYRQSIEDARLEVVVNVVRSWLWPVK